MLFYTKQLQNSHTLLLHVLDKIDADGVLGTYIHTYVCTYVCTDVHFVIPHLCWCSPPWCLYNWSQSTYMVKMSYVYSAFSTFACTLSYAQDWLPLWTCMSVQWALLWMVPPYLCLLACCSGFPFWTCWPRAWNRMALTWSTHTLRESAVLYRWHIRTHTVFSTHCTGVHTHAQCTECSTVYIRTCKHYICASAHCTKWTVKAVLVVVYVRMLCCVVQ